MDAILFLFFAAIAVACGVSLVLQTHPISSALSLIGVMGSLAVLYLLLGAEFMAAAQLIVYAGAIMVLFVFVIMLLNAGRETRAAKSRVVKALGIPALLVFLGMLGYMILAAMPHHDPVTLGGFTGGTARDVGRAVFTTYLLPFEATSILVLIALVGAIVLARKEV